MEQEINYIPYIVGGVIFLWGYFTYVGLIKKRNNLRESSSGIDVQLKKRYDLIPNLMTMAAKYMEHEKELMTEVTRLRNEVMNVDFSKNPQEKIKLDNLLSEKMQQFKLTAENYPDMKSNDMMNNAMISLNEVEEHIAASRRFYNSSVKELKNAVEIFPSSLIAKLVGVKDDMPFFEAEEQAKQSVDAGNYFK
ncbi:MAG: LemA family protein [Alphaproteobacteria bacterium]